MKQTIVPVVSVAIGILAFLLTGQFIRRQQADIDKAWASLNSAREKVEVMVATHDLPQGTKLNASDMKPKHEFKALVGRESITKRDALQVLGRRTVFQITRGDAMKWSDIEGGAGATGLSSMINSGLRAISISVSGANAVSAMVRPTDRVDVLGTFTFPSKTVAGEMETVTLTVLQDVTVVATGQTTWRNMNSSEAMRRSSGYSTVTMEVTPEEAELLVFAQQTKGRLTLSLRNPEDVQFKRSLPDVNFKYLQEQLPNLNLIRQRDIRKKRNLPTVD